LKYWFPVLLYCCIIFGVSAVPVSELPPSVPFSDKAVHMLVYAVLAVLFARAVRHSSQTKWALMIWALAVYFVAFYGITDEFHQSFVSGRSSDLVDWAADVVGGTIGAAVYLFWKSKKQS
jgi:VanZ family protein